MMTPHARRENPSPALQAQTVIQSDTKYVGILLAYREV